MNRKIKGIILVIIIIVGIIMLLGMIMSRSKTGGVANNKMVKQVDHAQQVAEYQQNIKNIAADYRNIINAVKDNSTSTGSSSQISALEEMKNRLTNNSINVPAEFRDLHINFFISVLDLENYFKNNQLSAKASSSNLWQSLQKDYNWITK